MNGFVRTITGDVPADRRLGRCDAHEHIILAGGFIAEHYPDLLLDDVDAACREVAEFCEAGGGWIVDSMPTGPGRDAARLAAVSRRTGVPIVMPTGRHLACYHAADDPFLTLSREALADRFVEEIESGVGGDAAAGAFRCGVIKVASGAERPSDVEREALHAAAEAQRRTGCPILTHTEGDAKGVAAQIDTLANAGAALDRVTLSHTDRDPDPARHREWLRAGVRLEYDQHFRQVARGEPGATIDLIATLAPEFPGRIVLGMDMARRRYWRAHGGGPGLAWLVAELPRRLREAGLDDALIERLYVDNALAAFGFAVATTPETTPPSRRDPSASSSP